MDELGYKKKYETKMYCTLGPKNILLRRDHLKSN